MSDGKPLRANAQQAQARGRGRGRHGGKQKNDTSSTSKQQSHRRDTRRGVRLELIPSISRSGGDEGLGNSLKDEIIQVQYWEMIQEKIIAHWRQFPSHSENPSQIERESNILLLLRKLREGVLSSRRRDKFALDVYEASFYLAIIFRSSVQASSCLTHLLELYKTILADSQTTDDSFRSRAEAFAVISLIFHLGVAFPSQISFQRQMHTLEQLIIPKSNYSAALEWISTIQTAINRRNYARIDALTCEQRLRSVMEANDYLAESQKAANTDQQCYVRAALNSAVNEMRCKLRISAWSILRSAYREITLGSDTDTASWLSRSLFLEAIGDAGGIDAETWMDRCEKEGYAVKKEGLPGRWILRR